MAEIPEHLKKRAQEAKSKASKSKAAAPSGDSKGIPEHLLKRSKKAKGSSDTKTEVSSKSQDSSVVSGAPKQPKPVMSGPQGHTQRMLTVVKSGSIQDIRSKPLDKVHTWPHLIIVEFGAMLAVTAFLLVFSIFVNAPLQRLADVNSTPNPSKAPWYFLGLQELLTLFHPMVAGVTIPGIGIFALILAPYIDRNPSNKPEDRKFAFSLFTFFMMFWAVLSIIGSFFRGPGFNFVFPWEEGIFFEL